MTRGRVNIALDIARHVEHAFGILVNAQIVRCALQRNSKKKEKNKPHLSDKIVKACLDFARVHKH